MNREADIRLLDLRIESNSKCIEELRIKRALMQNRKTWELDHEIDRHERWLAIQVRLRGLVSERQREP